MSIVMSMKSTNPSPNQHRAFFFSPERPNLKSKPTKKSKIKKIKKSWLTCTNSSRAATENARRSSASPPKLTIISWNN